MTTGAILHDAVLPLLVLLLAWLTPSLITPTLPFGVRVPPARAQASVILRQRRAYRRLLATAGGAAVLTGLVLALAAPRLPAGPFVALAVGGVCATAYLRARQAIRAAKQQEGWYQGLRQAVVVDTSLRTDPERFPWPWALPAVLTTGATAVLGVLRYSSMPDRLPTHFNGPGRADAFAAKSVGTAFAPVLVQVLVTAALLLLPWLVFRARPDLDPARPAVSAYRHRRFIVRMAISVLLLAACADLSLLIAAWAIWHGQHTVSPAALLAPILLGLAIVIGISVRTGQNGSRLPAEEPVEAPVEDTGVVHQDDDRHWRLGGMLYVNRQDRSLFVPKRFGIGWTVNFGNPHVLWFPVLLGGFMLVMQLISR